MSETAWTQGAHHVGLTVPDLARASRFFVNTLGFRQVGEVPAYPAIFVTDGHTLITLWRAAEPEKAIPFDRKNVIGMHHLAFKVANGEALDALHRRLTAADGVEIEFAPQPLGGGPTRHLMCLIPGGIRVEFIAVGG